MMTERDFLIAFNSANGAYQAETGGGSLAPWGFSHVETWQDAATGFKARAYHDGAGNYILAFAGTEDLQDAYQDLANFGWGQWEETGPIVSSFFSQLKDQGVVINSIQFTGHSLGGALAQYAAYDFVAEGVITSEKALLTTFNALGGELALVNELGIDYQANLLATSNIHHYFDPSDLVSMLSPHLGGQSANYQLRASTEPIFTLDAHLMSTIQIYIGNGLMTGLQASHDYFEIDEIVPALQMLGSATNGWVSGGETEVNDVEAAARILSMVAIIPRLLVDPSAEAQWDAFKGFLVDNLVVTTLAPKFGITSDDGILALKVAVDLSIQGVGGLISYKTNEGVIQAGAGLTAFFAEAYDWLTGGPDIDPSDKALTYSILNYLVGATLSIDANGRFDERIRENIANDIFGFAHNTEDASFPRLLGQIGGLLGRNLDGSYKDAVLLAHDIVEQEIQLADFLVPADQYTQERILDIVRTDTLDARLLRYTVLNQLPFILEDVSSEFISSSILTDPRYGPSDESDQYWTDRVAMLHWKMEFDATDSDYSEFFSADVDGNTTYTDLGMLVNGQPLRLSIDGNGLALPYDQIKFGTDAAESIDGVDSHTGGGNDRLYGGGGDDAIDGKGGDDYLAGGRGNDTLTGGGGNDTLEGGAGHDTYLFQSGDGMDVVSDTGAGDRIAINGEIIDRISRVSEGASVLVALTAAGNRIDGITLLETSDGLLVTYGDNDSIVLKGWDVATGNYDMVVDGDQEPEVVQPQEGMLVIAKPLTYWHPEWRVNDSYMVDDYQYRASMTDWAWVNQRPIHLIGAAEFQSNTGVYGFEHNYHWGAFDGGDLNDILEGTYGTFERDHDYAVTHDLLRGKGGDDLIYGDRQQISLELSAIYGVRYAEEPSFYEKDDTLSGGTGSDVIFGDGGADILFGYEEIEAPFILWHKDFDYAEYYWRERDDYSEGDDPSDYTSVPLENADDSDYLDGGAGNDLIFGGSYNDTLIGGLDHDYLAAGAGADTIVGGTGHDTIWGDSSAHFVNRSGLPDDFLQREALVPVREDGNWWIREREQAWLHQLYEEGKVYVDEFVNVSRDGLVYNDIIDAGEGNDFVLGEIGDDLINGGDGSDVLAGDRLNLSEAREAFYQQQVQLIDGTTVFKVDLHYADLDVSLHGDDRIMGGAGHDKLYGNGGNDHLWGGADHDELTGGEGNDVLSGGSGSDVYLYAPGDGNDVIINDDPAYLRNDVLRFGEGIFAEDVVLAGIGNDSLEVTFQSNAGRILIQGFFADRTESGGDLDWIEFSDGSSWSYADVVARVVSGTEGGGAGSGNGDNGEGGTEGGGESGNGEGGSGTIVNAAPVLTTPIVAPDIAEDAAFSFSIPAATFSDVDGDSLTFTATQADGSPLPLWLSFDGSNFSGTPTADDIGPLSIRVIASDGVATASTLFVVNVLNTNDAPVVATAIAQQTASEDAAFSFTIPVNAFADEDGDALTFSVDSLPSWLSFDGTTFSGTPTNAEVGSTEITVTATDGTTPVSTSFRLTVTNTNDAPVVAMALLNQSVVEGDLLAFALPEGSFTDPDAGDSLEYSASLVDGLPLPDWLHFDPATRLFSGTPGAGDVGLLTLRVLATDLFGASVASSFSVNVTNRDSYDFTLDGTSSGNTLTGTAGRDLIDGLAGNDTIYGLNGNDTLIGGLGNDTLYGGEGDDEFRVEGSGQGSDRFYGDAGNDVIVGGEGNDTIVMTRFDLASSIERIDGGDGINILTGTSSGNVLDFSATTLSGIAHIDGGAGNDTITGSAGDDRIIGGTGNDTLNGGDGDDEFVIEGVGQGSDTVLGGAGFDSILGGDGDDIFMLARFDQDSSIERIVGGDGLNILMGTSSSNVLDFTNIELSGIAHIDGGAGNDTIIGSTGNDRIIGGAGNDTLYGDEGDDEFVVEGVAQGADTIWGGDGFDTILGGAGDDTMTLVRFDQGSSIELIAGGAGTNLLTGTASSNVLDFTSTTLTGIAHIDGGAGNDVIIGSAGADVLLGSAGADTLRGGVGDDQLTGGLGNDTLDGGLGSDCYGFGPGMGADLIQNLDADEASIDIARFEGVAVEDLWFSRSGNHLVLTLAGTVDRVTVSNWYASPDSQLDRIEAGDWHLLNSQVDQLVSAMSAFAVPSGAGNIIPQTTKDQLQPVLASTWQAA